MAPLTFVLAPGGNAFISEIAEGIRFELDAIGAETAVSGEFGGDGPFALLAPHEYAALAPHQLEAAPLERTVAICTEEPGSAWFEMAAPVAAACGATFDIGAHGTAELVRRGVHAERLRLGYTAAWEPEAPAAGRDIEIAFLGGANLRRNRYLAEYCDSIWDNSTRLVLGDSSRPASGDSATFIAGPSKRALLARTQVLLNLHRDQRNYFEWPRTLDAIHCGAVVVSERSSGFDPLVPGEHLMFGEPASMALIARALLDDLDRLERMRNDALELLRSELPMRAAAELLAAASADIGSGSGTTSLPAAPPPPAQEPPPTVLGVLAGATSNGAVPPPVVVPELREVAQTPGYSLASPRVTAIVPLYNRAELIGATLDSVAASDFSDVDIVVVDHGSTDDSVNSVCGWIEANPGSALLLARLEENTGLPAVPRNAALELARGELILALDSDNQLYPAGLGRLVAALDADPGASFSYGILQTFSHEGPGGLLNVHGWDPARLAEWNEIDNLALIRAEPLREAGGYSTQPGLNLEDYDLWCTFAEHGLHGAHVAEPVARYRVTGEASARESAGKAEITGLRVLVERHPALFGQAPAV